MVHDALNASSEYDVTLLLEGTYPYIKGGVSSWVHGLITGLPHIRFGAVFLGSRCQDYGPIQYSIPVNLVSLQSHYLFDKEGNDKSGHLPWSRFGKADVQDQFRVLHQSLEQGEDTMPDPADLLDPHSIWNRRYFMRSRQAWEYIAQSYEDHSSEPSFIDYFWTIRNLHYPIWILARIAHNLPPTQVLFSPSTGYAGFLAAMGAKAQGKPFILMEHGIYTKERRIDLMNADWIEDRRNPLLKDPTDTGYLRELWIRFFEILGNLAYRQAHPIISLFDAARCQQIADGADPAKTRIIPNGVDVAHLKKLRHPPDESPPKVVCLLGRVVSIKDIKTFIRCVHELRQILPDVQGWVVGPEDEDPDYVRECHELVTVLDLTSHLRFLGFRSIDDILPKVGLLVLSSISEGLPLSILEGFAAGLPAVTTEVGACPELILGRGDVDRALGAAGETVHLADHKAMAEACARLLSSPAVYHRAASAAIARVECYYDRRKMLDTFAVLFDEKIRQARQA